MRLTPWIIFIVILIHGYWGVAALLWPETLLVTPIHPLVALLGGKMPVVSFLLLSVLTAILALRKKIDRTYRGFLLLLPQQFAMMVTLFGLAAIVINGAYPDGYAPAGNAHAFIMADQIGYAVIALVHTAAVLYRYSVIVIGSAGWKLL